MERFSINLFFLILWLIVPGLSPLSLRAAGTPGAPIEINIGTVVDDIYDGYTAAAGTLTINENGHYLLTGTTARQIIIATGLSDVNITLNNANINVEDGNAIRIGAAPVSSCATPAAATHLKLTLYGINTATTTAVGQAGILIHKDAKLTIDGVGQLTATGGDSSNKAGGGAGIGSNGYGDATAANEPCYRQGAIDIYGGVIIATGGNANASNSGGGAGIGGGGGQACSGIGVGGSINIYGGDITANGGNVTANSNGAGGGAGIGGGGAGKAGNEGGHNQGGIYIHGGTINASGGSMTGGNGSGGAGIGGGGAQNDNERGRGGFFNNPPLIVIDGNSDVSAIGGRGNGSGGNGDDIGDGGAGTTNSSPTLRNIRCSEPISLNVSEGTSGQFSIEAAFQNATALTYQWYKDPTGTVIENGQEVPAGGTLISGVTSNAYSTETTLQAGIYEYYCIVTAINGNYSTSATSPCIYSLNVEETVRKEIALTSESRFVFANRVEGYAVPPVLNIEVTNLGNYAFAAGELRITYSGDDFLDINKPVALAALEPGRTLSFSLVAKTGLQVGNYTSVVTVSDGDISQSVTIRFTVTACEVSDIEILLDEENPPKLTYCEGETLDLSNLRIRQTIIETNTCTLQGETNEIEIGYEDFAGNGIYVNYSNGTTMTMEHNGQEFIVSVSYGTIMKDIGILTINRKYFDVTVASADNGIASATPTKAVLPGTDITLSATPNAGYEFSHWEVLYTKVENDCVTPTDSPIIAANLFAMPSGDITVKAVFKEIDEETIQYTITYNANGGEGTMSDIIVNQGDTHIVLPNVFTRLGFAFTGWKDESGTLFSAGSPITAIAGNVNLYAQWTEKTVSVGEQMSVLEAGKTAQTTFPVSTTHIPDGTYAVSVTGRPVGVTIIGSVTIADNRGILTLGSNINSQEGEYTDLVLTIDGAVSEEFTLILVECIPDYEMPTRLTAVENQTLAEVALPTGWRWNNEAIIVGNVGERWHNATFTPDTEEECNDPITINLPVNVYAQPRICPAERLTVSGSISGGVAPYALRLECVDKTKEPEAILFTQDFWVDRNGVFTEQTTFRPTQSLTCRIVENAATLIEFDIIIIRPEITSVSADGDKVSVEGKDFNFRTEEFPPAVYFGELPASNVWVESDTEISCTAPQQAAGKQVKITVVTACCRTVGDMLYTY